MRTNYLLIPLLLFCGITAIAQKKKNQKVTVTKPPSALSTTLDTTRLDDARQNVIDNIPIISLDDNDLDDGSSQNISSALTAGRDPFFSAASFNFSSARFKIRGYDAENFTTYMNGVPMESLDNGFTPFGFWGGLNDVMRNKDLSIGLRYNTFSFGEIGSATSIDSRASKQRKQTEVGYAFSNRNYTHRWSITHSTGISKKGWAFTFSGSRRYADEGYVPGTYYNGWSYFVGIDKRLSKKTLLSLVVFGAPTESGKQSAATKEIMDLAGTHYYNSYWGYQVGKKRNANVAKTNQPYIILTHDHHFDNKASLVTAAAFSFGQRGSTALDWYNSQDPRPDYYRNLPSYYAITNPALSQVLADNLRNNESARQINWANIYEANRGNVETFNGTTGKRSRYLLSEAVTESKRFNFNSTYNNRLSNHVEMTAGVSMQTQSNNYYKQVDDLLGGDYFADLNQFAERSYPNNPTANQPDVNNPNRVVKVGDKYQYNYNIYFRKTSAWAQGVFKFNKFDFFAAGEISNTLFYRTGNYKNGLFQSNSYGKSAENEFTNYSVKAGVTYKFDGRNYIYVNGAYLTKAPYYDNVYISARTRDTRQDNVTNETVKTIDAGYVLNAPKIKIRLSGYYTTFQDGMNVLSFYHDDYKNLVNYAINNINKLHFGGEFGFETKITSTLSVNGAASVGRYYYNSRQNTTTTLDNDASVLNRDTVYNLNYRVGGTPQEAYSLGLSYRSPKFWSISLTGNYFDQMWLDANPIRRTARAVDGLDPKSDAWKQILAQEQFPAQYTIDIFATYSWKLPKSLGLKKATFLVFNLGASNLLNNKDIITGGYEQLRFDFEGRNPNKFPPKYYYSYGANYFASATLRF